MGRTLCLVTLLLQATASLAAPRVHGKAETPTGGLGGFPTGIPDFSGFPTPGAGFSTPGGGFHTPGHGGGHHTPGADFPGFSGVIPTGVQTGFPSIPTGSSKLRSLSKRSDDWFSSEEFEGLEDGDDEGSDEGAPDGGEGANTPPAGGRPSGAPTGGHGGHHHSGSHPAGPRPTGTPGSGHGGGHPTGTPGGFETRTRGGGSPSGANALYWIDPTEAPEA